MENYYTKGCKITPYSVTFMWIRYSIMRLLAIVLIIVGIVLSIKPDCYSDLKIFGYGLLGVYAIGFYYSRSRF